ncbi:MAG: hypothetical protein WKG07_32470 [Hymenobacter sp.]
MHHSRRQRRLAGGLAHALRGHFRYPRHLVYSALRVRVFAAGFQLLRAVRVHPRGAHSRQYPPEIRFPEVPLRGVPQYHHRHHGDDPAHYGINFAIHFPLIDKVFGTYYLPGNEWPAATGVARPPTPRLREAAGHPFTKSPFDHNLP